VLRVSAVNAWLTAATPAHKAILRIRLFLIVDFILFLLQWLVDVCTVEEALSSCEHIATKCKKTGVKLQKYALNVAQGRRQHSLV
jgi:hypothetical protein